MRRSVTIAAAAVFTTFIFADSIIAQPAPPAQRPSAPPQRSGPATKPAAAPKLDPALVNRGRYLAKIGGCNDCHTAGYAPSGGKVPEKDWLLGDKLGWRGPWGTTYPTNLRQFIDKMSEKDWMAYAKTIETRPPMPWFAIRDMTAGDQRALYHFMKSLGPAGEPAPAYVPPNQEPPQPFVQFPASPQ